MLTLLKAHTRAPLVNVSQNYCRPAVEASCPIENTKESREPYTSKALALMRQSCHCRQDR